MKWVVILSHFTDGAVEVQGGYKGDLQICSEVGNSRGRVLVPDCPLPALQRHSKILELYSMKEQGSGMGQRGLAPYWPQLSYCLSIQTRTRAYFMKCKGLLLSKLPRATAMGKNFFPLLKIINSNIYL